MSKRHSRRSPRPQTQQRAPRQLAEALDSARSDLEAGNPQAAIDQLGPLSGQFSRSPELFTLLGYAHLAAKDLFSAAEHLRRALDLGRDSSLYIPLASIYHKLELTGLSLDAFRRIPRDRLAEPELEELDLAKSMLEAEVSDLAVILGLKTHLVEATLRHLGEGQLALQQQEYLRCVAENRRAIRIAGPWPPLVNNMSMAYFFSGNRADAIATAEQVLAHDPHNLHALANLIRFVNQSGDHARARALWERLKPLPLVDRGSLRKKIEAAAELGEDEAVYELFQARDALVGNADAAFDDWETRHLAVALANTGRKGAAELLAGQASRTPWIREMVAALEDDRPGPGWSGRYPYESAFSLIPHSELGGFFEHLAREGQLSEVKFRREIERFVARFPQIVRFGERLLLEMQDAKHGILLLQTLATPEAYAALQSFAFGKAGPDNARMQALMVLQSAGQIDPDRPAQVWIEADGEWHDVALQSYELTERELSYAPAVIDLLERGAQALNAGAEEEAERLLRRAVQLEPRATEAYSNLGVLYNRRSRPEKAIQMYRQAIAIDPAYVFPRCNLALNLLDQEDVEGARQSLEPVLEVKRMHPLEAVMLGYVQARILVEEDDYPAARSALGLSLEIDPEYEPALDLLDHIELVERVMGGAETFLGQMRARAKNRRRKLQTVLKSEAPPLREVLELYTKDQLTGIARLVLSSGGWSALRKAALIDRIMAELMDSHHLRRIVSDLTPVEAAALHKVLDAGGALDWDAFDREFGNDLEESPYWNWHPAESVMGRLRSQSLLAESTVAGEVRVVVPEELREPLWELIRGGGT